MITRLKAQNFKCLREVDVAFTPLTVLIGPNNSGKSTVLEAISAVNRFYFGAPASERDSSSGSGERQPSLTGSAFSGIWAPHLLAWRRGENLKVALELSATSAVNTQSADIGCKATLAPDLEFSMNVGASDPLVHRAGEWLGPGIPTRVGPDDTPYARTRPSLKIFDSAARHFEASERYQFAPKELRKESFATPNSSLSATGDNLVSILDFLLTQADRRPLRDLETALHTAIPTLSGISTRPSPSGNRKKTIEFVLSGSEPKPITIPCSHISDGAMLLTAFLALAYSDTPEVVLIEEPENGLHPERLGEIVTLLRKMTTGQVGKKPRQVILTTHSPILLNFVEPEEVRIVQLGEDGASKVTPMTDVPDIRTLLKEFAVGELWYLLGEKALVEGKKP